MAVVGIALDLKTVDQHGSEIVGDHLRVRLPQTMRITEIGGLETAVRRPAAEGAILTHTSQLMGGTME